MDYRVCPVCKQEKHFIEFQDVRCSDSIEEYHICTDCKSRFLHLQYDFLGDAVKK